MSTIERVGVLFYLLAAAGLLLEMRLKKRSLRNYALITLAVGFALDTIGLSLRVSESFAMGQLPLTGAGSAAGILAWILAGVVLVIQMQNRLFALAAYLAPIAAMCALTALFLPESKVPLVQSVPRTVLLTHIVFYFVGIGIFCLAFLAAALYLLADRSLKARKFPMLLRLSPPLALLDRITVRALSIGLVFLTAGIASGIHVAHFLWSPHWLQDPKVISSFVTWGWYVTLLIVRHMAGWRGARFFALLVVGFVFLAFTFVGVTLIFPQGEHHYLSWIAGGLSWT